MRVKKGIVLPIILFLLLFSVAHAQQTTITDATTTGPFEHSTNCETLDLDQSCTVDLTFSPTSLGSQKGNLRVSFDQYPSLNIPLRGIGVNEQNKATKGPLNLELTFKEAAGVGVSNYPTQVVVPFARGQYFDTSSFRLVDVEGNVIPAQFDVLNRWWYDDGSLRHIVVRTTLSIDAFTSKGTGEKTVFLKDDGGNPKDSNLKVTEDVNTITVVTGPLKFVVNKQQFSIIEEAWIDANNNGEFETQERIVKPSSENGGYLVDWQQNDRKDNVRNDVTVEIETLGPQQVVIKAFAPTLLASKEDMTHGFGVRIYAYANQPFVKIDYQLQNSAKEPAGWYLYFEEMNLNYQLDFDSTPTVDIGKGDGTAFSRSRDQGLTLAQTMHDSYEIKENDQTVSSGSKPDGYLNVQDGTKGITAATRYFWQAWPNGLSIDSQNKLSVQLWPEWSSMWYGKKLSKTGLYWLQDMQHTYKQTMLYFHDGDADHAELEKVTKTFNHHPVGVVPVSWYKTSKATLGAGGEFPAKTSSSKETRRIPSYSSHPPSDDKYIFNWINFRGVGFERKSRPCTTGGLPGSAVSYLITGNPASYFAGEQLAMGDLNLRPQWMADYTYEDDFDRIELSEATYCIGTWRRVGRKKPTLIADLLPSTGKSWAARDDAHGWHYHIEESYYYTANPWVKDWMEFIGEFRKAQLWGRLQYSPGGNTRGPAHMINNAIQAYRVTGDVTILDAIFEGYFKGRTKNNKLIDNVHRPVYGYGDKGGFQTGFFAHAMMHVAGEVQGNPQRYAQVLHHLVRDAEWQYRYGNFPYYYDLKEKYPSLGGPSTAAGKTGIDPVMFTYLRTGKQEYFDDAYKYVEVGLGSPGKIPSKKHFRDGWYGQWVNRIYQHAVTTPRGDTQAPNRITDLTLSKNGDQVTLSWTTPTADDLDRFHIVYSKKPIVDNFPLDPAVQNWWEAKPYAPSLAPISGQQQSVTFTPTITEDIYAAIFTFDTTQNMASMSNVAHASSSSITGNVVSDTTSYLVASSHSSVNFGPVVVGKTSDPYSVRLVFQRSDAPLPEPEPTPQPSPQPSPTPAPIEEVLTIQSVSTSSPFSTSHSCTELNPGEKCKIQVRFAPTTEGSFKELVTIQTSQGTYEATLKGSAVSQPVEQPPQPTPEPEKSPDWDRSFVPCGGKDQHLWAWGWAGEKGEHVQTESASGGRVWTRMEDLSGNGNHFWGGGVFTGDESRYQPNGFKGRGPGYEVGFSWSCGSCNGGQPLSYKTDFPIIGVHKFRSGKDYFHNVAYQHEGMKADGPFYLAFSGMNTRTQGHREIFGSEQRNTLSYDQNKNRLYIKIDGEQHRIDNDIQIPKGPVIIEVMRDHENKIHSWVNSKPFGTGQIVSDKVFDVSGLGYDSGGTSQFDDTAFEYVMCKGAVSSSQRIATRHYLNSKWQIYEDADKEDQPTQPAPTPTPEPQPPVPDDPPPESSPEPEQPSPTPDQPSPVVKPDAISSLSELWVWTHGEAPMKIEGKMTSRGETYPLIVYLEDLSGNGNHFYKDAVAEDPKTKNLQGFPFQANAKNGLPSLGARVYGDLGFNQKNRLVTDGPFYFAFAAQMNNGHRQVMGLDRSGKISGARDIINIDGRNQRVQNRIGGVWKTHSNKRTIPYTSVIMEIWRDENNLMTVLVNGKDTSLNPKASHPGTLDIGGLGGDWNRALYELIVVDGLPSEQERNDVRNYLSQRWNIATS